MSAETSAHVFGLQRCVKHPVASLIREHVQMQERVLVANKGKGLLSYSGFTSEGTLRSEVVPCVEGPETSLHFAKIGVCVSDTTIQQGGRPREQRLLT